MNLKYVRESVVLLRKLACCWFCPHIQEGAHPLPAHSSVLQDAVSSYIPYQFDCDAYWDLWNWL